MAPKNETKKPPRPRVFKPNPASKPIVMSAADSAPPAPPAAPAAPAAPAPVAPDQAMPAYDLQYNAATTDAQRQAIVAARDETAAGIAAANDAYHKSRGTGPYARAGGGTTSTDETDPFEYEKERDKSAKRLRSKNSIAVMRGLMSQYGLDSLMGVIEGYVTDGYDDDTIAQLIKTSPQYAERFPAMAALNKKKRVISEAEYISFEREAAQYERTYGLPAGMLGKTSITTLLENEVSARELEERVTMAAAGAFQTSPEIKQQFKNFYGIDSGGLTAYFLDPDKALPLLNKQYASAQIGGAAANQGIGIGVSMAEELTVAGITQQDAMEGFGTVASQKGLTTGRGDKVTQDQLIKGNLLGSQEAQENIQRASSSRTGRFQEGGSYMSGQGQTSGLGTSATR